MHKSMETRDEYNARHREYMRSYMSSPERRAQRRQRINQRRHQLKIEKFVLYGGACLCCGESNSSFLALDKITGGHGAMHRKRGYKQQSTDDFRHFGYRPDFFQLLCHNCNHAKSFDPLGCPHMRWMVA